MFEKDAEEWVIDSVCKDCSRYEKCKSKEHCTCKKCSKEKWQKGAEFGYNKAIEELKQAKKLLEKWLFFNGFNSALKKETEDFLGTKTEEIGIPEGVEEIKWQKKTLKNS